MYSRPSAFGPPCAGYNGSDETEFYDSRDGFNPPFTPPYYDGEAWIDFVWKALKPAMLHWLLVEKRASSRYQKSLALSQHRH